MAQIHHKGTEKVRDSLLFQLGESLYRKAAYDESFFGQQRVAISSFEKTCGPRSGVLTLDAGVHADKLYALLTRHNHAKLRYVFPKSWIDDNSEIEPSVRFVGRNLLIEANWPKHLQTETLPFSEVRQRPGNGRSFTLGRDMRNSDVTITLKGIGTHVLIGGITGSGKTVTLHTIIRQLLQVKDAQFVLLNGKGLRGLGLVNGLPGQVGPMASSVIEARDALGWVFNVMTERNNAPQGTAFPPIFVIADEFDVFTMSDSIIAQLLFFLVKMGRETNIFLICATQEPKQEMFGTRGTRGQFGTRIALQVSDRHASEAILSATEPRADNLSGSGDSQVYAEGHYTRTLIAYTSEAEASRLGGGEPSLRSWPRFDKNAIETHRHGPEAKQFTVSESVLALRAALANWRRPTILKKMQQVLGYGMGSDRIDDKLIPHGQQLADLWREFDSCLTE